MNPKYIIKHGNHCAFKFYTLYHAEQYARALALNGTKYEFITV